MKFSTLSHFFVYACRFRSWKNNLVCQRYNLSNMSTSNHGLMVLFALCFIYIFAIQCMVEHMYFTLDRTFFYIKYKTLCCIQHNHSFSRDGYILMWEIRDTKRRQIKVNEKTTWAYVAGNPYVCAVLQAFCLMKMCKPSGICNLFSIFCALWYICETLAVSIGPSMQLVRMWRVENRLFFSWKMV